MQAGSLRARNSLPTPGADVTGVLGADNHTESAAGADGLLDLQRGTRALARLPSV